MSKTDLDRLVCAAVVDKQFRALLLRDPLRAAEGYYAERFHLTAEELDLIAHIQANNFDGFVQAIAEWIIQTHK